MQTPFENPVIQFKRKASKLCKIDPDLGVGLSIRDIFATAHAQSIDLSGNTELTRYYLSSTVDDWLSSGGNCGWLVPNEGRFNSLAINNASLFFRKVRNLDDPTWIQKARAMLYIDHEFFLLLPEKHKAPWLYNLRDLNTDFIRLLSYESERNRTDLEILIADRFASDALSQEIISKAFPMKLFLEMQEFVRGNDYNYLVEMILDMNRFKGADAVEDCLRIDDKFIHQKFVLGCLESLRLGFGFADDAIAAIFDIQKDGRIYPVTQRTLAMRIFREFSSMVNLTESFNQQQRLFWIDHLPEALMQMRELDFSPLPGVMSLVIDKAIPLMGGHPLATELMGIKARFDELLSNNDQIMYSAIHFLSELEDKQHVIDFHKRFCNPDHFSEFIRSLAKQMRPVTNALYRKYSSSEGSWFFRADVAKNFILDKDKDLSAAIGKEMLAIFDGKHYSRQLAEFPGIKLFIKHLAEHEGWSGKERAQLAISTRSAPIRKMMIQLLDVPASEFGKFPASLRRALLESDLGL